SSPSSIASKAPQIRSRSSSNQARAVAFFASTSAGSPAGMSGRSILRSSQHRRAAAPKDSSFSESIPNLSGARVKPTVACIPEFPLRTPTRPPLDSLKKRLDRSRAEKTRLPRDGFLRETFVLPRGDARVKAREWFDRWPKQAYWTAIERWAEHPGDVIEFTMRRLPAAD